MKNLFYAALCGVLLAAAGCATVDYSFVNPNVKVAGERKVAVFPFVVDIDDYAALRVSKAREEASSMVSRIFVKELSRKTRYEIISPCEVADKLLLDKGKLNWLYKGFLGDVYERNALTSERLRELGSQLGAQAILVGKITDFGRYQQDGILWTGAGLRIKMVDTKSGEVLWEARDKIADVSPITHSHSTLEANAASYPVVTGGVDKEPKYKTGQGYFYNAPGEFPYHIDYENTAIKLCRKIISTFPRY